MALEASRTLTDLLEPAAAGLVQSELRLLSRDLQEISWRLSLKLGQLQVGAGGRAGGRSLDHVGSFIPDL